MRAFAVIAVVSSTLFLGELDAWANGAFPDALRIFAPPDSPNRIILATNFGLVLSEDDGATWQLVCEAAISMGAFLYDVGPAPAQRIFALSLSGLFVSEDQGCSFNTAQGVISGGVHDVYADQTDPLHVLVIARTGQDTSSNLGVFESHDGGHNFGAVRFTAPSGIVLNGIEVARSHPQTIYLTGYDRAGALLYRSDDGGSSYQGPRHMSTELGGRSVLLAAIDPMDPNTVYLRTIDGGGDYVAYTHDGGMTVHLSVQLDSKMTSLIPNGESVMTTSALGSVYTSTDGASSFHTMTGWPEVRAMAVRSGSLYAAANNFIDNYAVGVSQDGGATWKHLLAFKSIAGVKQCGNVVSLCSQPWMALMQQFDQAGMFADAGGTTPPGMPAPPPGDPNPTAFPMTDASSATTMNPNPSSPSSSASCACVSRTLDGSRSGGVVLGLTAIVILSRKRRALT